MLTYDQVPKDIAENAAYRVDLLNHAGRDVATRRLIQKSCAEDILFWLNVVGYTFDPRREEDDREIPFITWGFQDEAIRTMAEAFGKEDVLVEKSRDMGASWLILALFTHRWQFKSHSALGLISSTEALVDSGHNPKSLFWKVRFLLERQPKWMLPDYLDQQLILHNKANNSTMTGFTTTANVARGDRLLAAMIDEFAAFDYGDGYRVNASTHAVTNCRIFNSTYAGAAGCFYDLSRMAKDGKMTLISLPWTLHPEKMKDLNWDDKGRPTSSWYRKQCERLGGVRALIGAELDMDPAGSASQYFSAEMIDRLVAQDSRPAYHTGRIEAGRFREDSSGALRLWFHPTNDRPPFDEKYAVGCDVAMGAGASNSVASVVAQTTGEKVAELASPYLSPDEFASEVVALCHYFNDAFLTWESNGPGGRFGARVVEELEYGNVYYRRNEESVGHKITDTPGWSATPKNKRLLFGEYGAALAEGRFINRSREALEECRLIILDPTGKITNSRAAASVDPSGAGENHADRPTADALAVKGLAQVGPRPEPEKPKSDYIDPRTMEGRRKLREKERQHADEW